MKSSQLLYHMKTIKCIFRTLLYSALLLFTVCSLLIVSNPKRFGVTYYAIKQSATNIFFPTTFEEFRPYLVAYSFTKLSRWNDHEIIQILEDGFMFESWYWCKYRYIDKDGTIKVNIDHVIHNWKPWEYYYFEENKNFLTPEHIRADNLRKEWMTKYRDPEVEKYRRYQIN